MSPIGLDPTLIKLGPFEIRWYALMYIVGFLLGHRLLLYLSQKNFLKIGKEDIERYISYLIVGMFLGARFAYVFIYNWDYYSHNLDELLAVWKGGLSFHGAVIGMCVSTYLFARQKKLHFFHLTDCMALAGTPGLFFGRMGNFINGELYGRVTSSAFGIV